MERTLGSGLGDLRRELARSTRPTNYAIRSWYRAAFHGDKLTWWRYMALQFEFNQ